MAALVGPRSDLGCCAVDSYRNFNRSRQNYECCSSLIMLSDLTNSLIGRRTSDQQRRSCSQRDSMCQLQDLMAQRTRQLVGSRKPERRLNRSALASRPKRQDISMLSEALAKGKLQDLLQHIIEKEIRLRELDEAVEKRKAELEELEVQFNKRIAACRREHTTLEMLIRNEKENLVDVQSKLRELESTYDRKKQELASGRTQLQELLECVERIGKEYDIKAAQLQNQELSVVEKRNELVSLQKDLQTVNQRLSIDRQRVDTIQRQLQAKIQQLKARSDQIQQQSQRLARIRSDQTQKQLQLSEREKVISAYVNQLNYSIAQLTVERGGLSQLGMRWQKLMEDIQSKLIFAHQKESDFNFNKTETNFNKTTTVQSMENAAHKTVAGDKLFKCQLTNDVYRSERRYPSFFGRQVSPIFNLPNIFTDTGMLIVDSPSEIRHS